MNAAMKGRFPAWAAAAGHLFFLVTASVVQGVRFHDAAATPISAYLRGTASDWLQTAYYVLAVAMTMLALRFALRRHFVHAVAAIALIVGAVAVVLVAYSYSPWPLPGDPRPAMRISIHVASAFTAFLSVTIAMFLETPRVWQQGTRVVALSYAVIVLALEIAAVLASSHAHSIYGALEKLSVAGLVLWLLAASLASLGGDRRH